MIRDLGGKFRQKQIYLFWAFWSLIFKFSFKRGNHEEHPLSKCGWISALDNSLPNAEVRYLFFRWRNFSLGFIFPRIFDATASLLNLESNWHPKVLYCVVCLNGIARKRYSYNNFLQTFCRWKENGISSRNVWRLSWFIC